LIQSNEAMDMSVLLPQLAAAEITAHRPRAIAGSGERMRIFAMWLGAIVLVAASSSPAGAQPVADF
jgi:hypothetical protein